MTEYEPRLGDTVEDTGLAKVGRVMGFVGPYVQLRPVGGGIEWDARVGSLRPVLLTDALRNGVAAANARSRGEGSTVAQDSIPVDAVTMRRTIARVFADDAVPLTAEELHDLVLLCRGHLMLLIPEVGRVGRGLPEGDVRRTGALAGIAEARRRLDLVPDEQPRARVAHARRLARSVDCLLRHVEALGGELS
ncbi:hypothetical protein OK074_3145 [Actinobacteria bacterium OK074]|nr:hypothetical protein OK074_3145 [Actinobacteria bacterium OK074]